MTEKYQLKKNISTTVFAFGVNIALVFLTYRVLISVGSVALVGIWATTLAWASIIRFGDLGMSNASVRFVARYDLATEKEEVHKIISTGTLSNTILYLILNIAAYLILLAVLKHAFKDTEDLHTALNLLPYLLLGQFFSNAANMLLGILTGLHKGYLAAYLRIVGNIAQLILVVVLIPAFGIVGLAFAQILQFSVMTLIAWAVIGRTAELPRLLPQGIDRRVFREMLGFSISAQFSSIANSLFEPLTKILLSIFASTEVQGLYELAYKSAFLPRNGIVSAVNATLPAMTSLYRQDPPAFRSLYATATQRSLKMSLIVMASVAVLSPAPSYLWLGYIDKTYVFMTVMLALACVFSIWAAPAFLLSQIIGTFRILTISSMATNAGLAASIFTISLFVQNVSVPLIICLISLTIVVFSVVVKIFNELIAHD